MPEELFNWPELLEDGSGLLPLPNYDFAPVVESNVLRSQMDGGRSRQRSINTQELVTASVTFELTKAQYAAFVAVWRLRLNNGASWFKIRLPQPDGNALTLAQIRFISGYNPQHRAFENWDVSANIEFFEVPTLTEAALAALL